MTRLLLSSLFLASQMSLAAPAELPYQVLATLENRTEVRLGGYGSAMTAHPSKQAHFYLLTDRGPNAKYQGTQGKGKIFPLPNYTPRIAEVQLQSDGQLKIIQEILLKTPKGELISGRPNPKGMGATGEVAYDMEHLVLSEDPYGLDSEGLVALKDGGFWVSDEYGPHLVHYNASGIELERINPFGSGTKNRKLPAVFAKRRANRGMEGLAITPDESSLVGIMQSTMHNPSKKAISNKQLTRLVSFDIDSGKTKQYLYRQEADNLSNSEIVAISAQQFLVIERDGGFFGAKAKYKRLYKIDLSQATDVSGEFASEQGLMINGKTLEQNSWEELAAAGIKPVSKTLVADLLADLHYPHDKLEGLWLRNRKQVAVINDDDFAVSAKKGVVQQKILPATQQVDNSTLYIIDLEDSL